VTTILALAVVVGSTMAILAMPIAAQPSPSVLSPSVGPGLPAASAQGRLTSIGIYGPAEWDSPPHYLVMAAGHTWTLDESSMGVVLQFVAEEVTPVTIRKLGDCSLVLGFDVEPRSSHVVEFTADGEAAVRIGGGDGGFIGYDEAATSGCQPPASPLPSGAAPSAGPTTATILVTCGGRTYQGRGIKGPRVEPGADSRRARALQAALATYGEAFPGADAMEWHLAGRDDSGFLYLARDDRFAETGWLSIEAERGDGRWSTNMGGCDPRRVIAPDIGVTDWWLDPAFPTPKPEATELHVLILERDCASGQAPDGRIAAPEIAYGPSSVTVSIGVRRSEGDHSCPGNPAVPLTVVLAEPLGDRSLLDGSRLPPQPPEALEGWAE
jgi:hypothetical protein